MSETACLSCQTPFVKKFDHHTYCSNKCQVRARDQRLHKLGKKRKRLTPARRALEKRHRARHRDRIRERNRAWRAGRRDILRAQGRVKYQRNREILLSRGKARRALNKAKGIKISADYMRDAQLKFTMKKLKLYRADYDEVLTAQSGVCAICHRPEFRKIRSDGITRRLAIDHDHKTNKLRGLLCGDCNTGLGLFQDDILRLESAIAYLRKHLQ